MSNTKIILRGLSASGAILAPASLLAQYSPVAPFKGKIGKTVQDTKTDYPAHNPVARLGAPNVVWILLDDTGFGGVQPSAAWWRRPTWTISPRMD